MATEDAALNFIVDIENVGKFTGQIGKITDGLDKIADAAEAAHDAAEGGAGADKKSFFSRFMPKKEGGFFLQSLNLSKLGTSALTKAVEGLQFWAKSSLDTWIDHYKAMIDWRKEVGMDASTMNEFSGQLINSTRQYTFNIREAVAISRTLAMGAKGATKEILGMSASLAEFSSFTGASEDDLAKLARALTHTTKVLGRDQFQRSLGAVREAMRDVNAPTDEYLGLLVRSRSVLSLYGKSNKNVLRDFTAWHKVLIGQGLDLEHVESMTQQLSDRHSRLGKIMAESFRAVGEEKGMEKFVGRIRDMLRQVKDLTDPNQIQLLADLFGVPHEALPAISADLEKFVEAQRLFDKTQDMSLEAQRKRERERATGIEKLKLLWVDLKNAGAKTIESLQNIFEPFFDRMVVWLAGAGKGLLSWIQKLEQVFIRVHEKLIELGLIKKKSDPIDQATRIGESYASTKSRISLRRRFIGDVSNKKNAKDLLESVGGDPSLLVPQDWALVQKHQPKLMHQFYKARREQVERQRGTRVPEVPTGADGANQVMVDELRASRKAQESLVEFEKEKKASRIQVGVPLSTGGGGGTEASKTGAIAAGGL